ncbi:nucleoside phosphorylase [bacterium SCSIO 12741]|nr:nucleoside phosphorylase [bacterium SCSIO 12741]
MRPRNPRIVNTPFPDSELVLNPDGSIYHLHLKPEHLADTIILVGDQGRVDQVSSFFERVDFEVQNREFKTKTGVFNGKRITVMSTGIGPDNMDIAINELDAAVNIDLQTRLPKESLKSLNLVRIGTCGSLQEDIPVDSFAISTFGMGMDGVLHYYDFEYDEEEQSIQQEIVRQLDWNPAAAEPYLVRSSTQLFDTLKEGMYGGITATAGGFYGPQGRQLRLSAHRPELNEQLNQFNHNGHRIINFEMETAALYGLGGMLGHQCCTVCAVIANRFTKSYSKDYKTTVNKLIESTLNRLTA